jgi:hypothetical protein
MTVTLKFTTHFPKMNFNINFHLGFHVPVSRVISPPKFYVDSLSLQSQLHVQHSNTKWCVNDLYCTRPLHIMFIKVQIHCQINIKSVAECYWKYREVPTFICSLIIAFSYGEMPASVWLHSDKMVTCYCQKCHLCSINVYYSRFTYMILQWLLKTL